MIPRRKTLHPIAQASEQMLLLYTNAQSHEERKHWGSELDRYFALADEIKEVGEDWDEIRRRERMGISRRGDGRMSRKEIVVRSVFDAIVTLGVSYICIHVIIYFYG